METYVETKRVFRPLKLIAIIAGFIATILLIVSVVGESWLEGERGGLEVHLLEGLWKRCELQKGKNQKCLFDFVKAYHKASAALSILALLMCGGITLFALVVYICMGVQERKRKFYFLSGIGMVVAFILEMIGLIVFIVSIMKDLPLEIGIQKWSFGWAFGIGWGAVIFMIGSSVLLIRRSETQELYSKDKTYYVNETEA